MRTLMTVLWIAAALACNSAGAQEQKKRWQPGPLWLAVGINGAAVEDSEQDCPGGQIAVGVGRTAFLKLQRASVTYEATDHTGSCDGGFVGDSSITEDALLLGVSSRNTGLFVAGGPARVRVDDEDLGDGLEDSGTRFELGWSSRRKRGSRSGHGLEVAGFAVTNEVASYRGIAVNWTIGPGGR